MRFGKLALAALFVLGTSSAVQAQLATFDLSYSGASFGNSAVGTGVITLDLATLSNPGFNQSLAPTYITSLSLTISGASSGNGTFSLADINTFKLDTNGGTLDFTRQLIGQPTAGASFGTPNGSGGDFNLFGSTLADPVGVFFFTLATSGGSGDQLLLTSIAPTTTPEPGSIAFLVGIGISGSVFVRRRKNARQAP